MNWLTAAIITPLAFLCYLLVINWINLYPWNDLAAAARPRKFWLDLMHVILLLYISWAFKMHNHMLIILAMIVVVCYLLLYIGSWWLPYFFGASEGWRLEHERLFGRTITILPRIKDHPTPNVGHMVLGLYIIVMVIVSINATFM